MLNNLFKLASLGKIAEAELREASPLPTELWSPSYKVLKVLTRRIHGHELLLEGQKANALHRNGPTDRPKDGHTIL